MFIMYRLKSRQIKSEYSAIVARNLAEIWLGLFITPLSIFSFFAVFFFKYRPKPRQI